MEPPLKPTRQASGESDQFVSSRSPHVGQNVQCPVSSRVHSFWRRTASIVSSKLRSSSASDATRTVNRSTAISSSQRGHPENRDTLRTKV